MGRAAGRHGGADRVDRRGRRSRRPHRRCRRSRWRSGRSSAPTEELAWEKAHRIVGQIAAAQGGRAASARRRYTAQARRTPARNGCSPSPSGATATTGPCGPRTAAVTGGARQLQRAGRHAETVAAALLDYYDLGIDILSARGYDILDDAIDFGRYVIPIVRAEVAKRDRERARLAEGAVAARLVTNAQLSILDLVPIVSGSDAASALHNTIDLARHAEAAGYRRSGSPSTI